MHVIEQLPVYEAKFITADNLVEQLKQAQEAGTCIDSHGKPFITLLDLRTDNFVETDVPVSSIKTNCPVSKHLFDDLSNPEVRERIPSDTTVVTVTETGNRDREAMQYLSKFGFTNIVGLKFGMRGWIKQDYPIISD